MEQLQLAVMLWSSIGHCRLHCGFVPSGLEQKTQSRFSDLSGLAP